MEEVKIGVYVCQCGINIASSVDVPNVVRFAGRLPNVTVARDYKYMCSEPAEKMIAGDIKEMGINRVVVASCTPRMHETTFQTVLKESGLNPYYFEMANIREHVSWVIKDREAGAENAKLLVRATVFRVDYQARVEPRKKPVTQASLSPAGAVTVRS